MKKTYLSTTMTGLMLSLASLTLPPISDLHAAEIFTKVTAGPGSGAGYSLGAAWGDYDGTITMWDLATRQQVAHWKAHGRELAWLRFVGKNEDLISLGDLSNLDPDHGDIRLWRAPSLSEIDKQTINP